MNIISQITEGLANLSIQTVLQAIGALMVVYLATRLIGRRRDSTVHWIHENVQVVLSVVVVVFLVIRPFLFQAFYIPSGSMEPTLMGPDLSTGRTMGDRLLVNKLIYRVANPSHSDIVVFRAPKRAASDEKEFIKRVIGVPGDTVQIVPDRLVVDGKVALKPSEDGSGGVQFDMEKKGGFKVEGKRASLAVDYQDRPLKVILTRNPLPSIDTARVIVDGKVELEDSSGQITVAPIANYGADPSINGWVYTRSGEVALAVIDGQKLEFQGPHIRINGKPISEPYLRQNGAEVPRYNPQTIKLGPHEYFMMGDNRNNSNDSRAWGVLTRDRVVGRAEVLFWPISRFRIMHWWLIAALGVILLAYNWVQRQIHRYEMAADEAIERTATIDARLPVERPA